MSSDNFQRTKLIFPEYDKFIIIGLNKKIPFEDLKF